MTDDRGRGRRKQQKDSRLQDFLMPGLRHAHTLQQLEVWLWVLFLRTCNHKTIALVYLVLSVISSGVGFVYLNTLPGVSTQ